MDFVGGAGMRMSRRLALYAAGGGKATVGVYGAPNETVTISNAKNTYTVTTGSTGAGTASLEIKHGTYTVTGSVSNAALPSGRTVTIDKNTTLVNVWPGDMVYWFGLFAGGVSYTAKNLVSGSPTLENRRIKVDPAQGYNGCISFTPTIKRGSRTKLNANVTWNPQNNSWWGCNIGLSTTDAADSSGIGATSYAVQVGGESGVSNYSCDISSVDADTSYYIKIRQYGNEFYVNAVWLEDGSSSETEGGGSGTEQLAGTNSVDVLSETYRYGSDAGDWATAETYSTDNYFGQKTGSLNSALIPVGSFTFSGTSTRLEISLYGYCPSTDFAANGFRWAICSSNANKDLYKVTTAVTGDSSQLASGVNFISYNSGNYTTYTLSLDATNLPANTPLYIYFWANGTGKGVAHFRGTLTAKLYYR